MDEQNNFSQQPNQEPSAEPQQETGGPDWYADFYRNNGPSSYSYGSMPPMPQKKKGGFRKVSLIALVVLACVLFSVISGFCGYYFWSRIGQVLSGTEDQSTGQMPDIPGSEGTGGLGGDSENAVYPYTDDSYDFTKVYAQISKNDGSSLVDSPNGSAGATPKSLIEAIAAVKDSVVEITTTVVSNRGQITAGAGSGVIIHADGIIVTNHHVVAGSARIYVRLTNGETYEAVLRGTDEEGDIAILKITPQPGKPLTVARLGNSGALALGERVFAIGNPLGELGGTVTDGIISATAREVNVDGVNMTLLQTNAAINSGNSGGGLFNLAGELIGVVNAKYSASGVEGLGFAIPIDAAYERSIKDLLEVGYVRGVPVMGIVLSEQTDTAGDYPFSYTVYGARVEDAGGVSGIRVGDYIYSIDNTVVYGITSSSLSMIRTIVRGHKVGDVIRVVVIRNNQKITVSVTLTEYVP